MYKLKCEKDFDIQLNIPEFSTRYYNLVNSNKKNIIYIKNYPLKKKSIRIF